jgi:hypothetical protein
MSQIELANVIEGGRQALYNAGAPVAGTDEVQTITIGGTPTGGTFTLTFGGFTTAPIPWSATNATLLASIDAALEALPNIGAGGVATAAGTLTAGIGTITVTFNGANLAKRAWTVMTANAAALTGTAPTVAVARTTPGVDATYRNAAPGQLLTDTTNSKVYVQTGVAGAPTWTVVGSQT